MKESLLDILCCPLDKHDLELEDAEYDDEKSSPGPSSVPECGEEYPIEDGIPNLLPPDMREETPA